MRGLILLIAIVLLHAAAASGETTWRPSDPRLIEASALMSDSSQYDRVIDLIQSVLADDERDSFARLWLARVLSWKGEFEDSLDHYGHMLAAAARQALSREELELERAEVLSWAGRYDSALAEFDRVLADDPENARALLGKARVQSWSGHPGEARELYEQSLLVEDNPVARLELKELAAGLKSGGDARSHYAFDSEGYEYTDITATSAVDLDFDTRMIATAVFSRVGRDSGQGVIPGPDTTNGFSALVGVERKIGERLKTTAQFGYRWWSEAQGHVLVNGSAEYSMKSDTVVSAAIGYSDFLEHSASFDVVLAGLDEVDLRMTAWQGLPHGFSAFAFLETGFVSDSNKRITLGASGEYRPLPGYDVSLGLSFAYLSFTESTDLYYDPSLDVVSNLSIVAYQSITDWFSLTAEAAIGLGYAKQDDIDGFGLTYVVSAGPRFEYGGWAISLFAARAQSQRATTYTSHRFGGALDVKF